MMTDAEREALEKINDTETATALIDTLTKLQESRPTDRSERARRYAVTITEMEKVCAYFAFWVAGDGAMKEDQETGE